MIYKAVAVTYFPIGVFISTTTGADVTTGTPTGTYSKDGTANTLSGTIAYDATAKEWGITGLTASEVNGDVIGLTFQLAGAVTIHHTISTFVGTLISRPSGPVKASPAPTTTAFTATLTSVGASSVLAGQTVEFQGGALDGQSALIDSDTVTGSDHALTFITALPVAPTAGDMVVIL